MPNRVNSIADLSLSLHQTASDSAVALCAALAFEPAANEVPEWIHLLPAGEIRTGDGRGPYRYSSAAKVIAASLQADQRLVIDENHSTDLAAPKGLPAPAMGWVVELQARADGIWGKVEWTDAGRQLIAGRAYRGISPVIVHDRAGNVGAVLRASLVNKPNLKGLRTLHSEDPDMNLLEKLLKALGLPSDTSEDTLLTAVTTLHSQGQDRQTALQAQLDPVAEAAGLNKGSKVEDVVAAIKQLAADNADAATVVALQAEVKDLGGKLVKLQQDGSRKEAETFVDDAIAKGRVGVKPQRDRYIAMHIANPADTEAIINDLPALNGTILSTTPAKGGKDKDGKRILSPEQERTIQLMQLDREAYIKTLDERDQAEAAL